MAPGHFYERPNDCLHLIQISYKIRLVKFTVRMERTSNLIDVIADTPKLHDQLTDALFDFLRRQIFTLGVSLRLGMYLGPDGATCLLRPLLNVGVLF